MKELSWLTWKKLQSIAHLLNELTVSAPGLGRFSPSCTLPHESREDFTTPRRRILSGEVLHFMVAGIRYLVSNTRRKKSLLPGCNHKVCFPFLFAFFSDEYSKREGITEETIEKEEQRHRWRVQLQTCNKILAATSSGYRSQPFRLRISSAQDRVATRLQQFCQFDHFVSNEQERIGLFAGVKCTRIWKPETIIYLPAPHWLHLTAFPKHAVRIPMLAAGTQPRGIPRSCFHCRPPSGRRTTSFLPTSPPAVLFFWEFPLVSFL